MEIASASPRNLKAIGNMVIIKPDKPVTETKSGIVLPFAEVDWCEGEVVSVGPKVKTPSQPSPRRVESATEGGGQINGWNLLCAGVRVKVRGEQGLDIEWEGEKYLIVSEHEVMAICYA